MPGNRKVIIVSPYFPPSSRAGVHRARHLAKHLVTYNWQPIIVHVEQQHYLETPDYRLASLLPAETRTVAAKALPISMTRLLGIGDLGIRAYWGIRSALAELIENESPDLVFITGSPFYPMLLSGFLRRRGVKVVLDYQDPWRSDFNESQPIWTKRGLSHLVAKLLEPRALKYCHGVTSVSKTQNEQLLRHYPFVREKLLTHFPIGGDPEDFNLLAGDQTVQLDKDKLNLVYVGAYLPRAEPLVRIFLRSLRQLVDKDGALGKRLRVNFIGTSNRPEDISYKPVSELAAQEQVADIVFEHPSRVPYVEALMLLAQSQGVLMIGSDERHYTASKIYPGLMSGKPYFAFFHEDSSSYAILSRAGGGAVVGMKEVADVAALLGPVIAALSMLVYSPEAFSVQDKSTYQDLTAKGISAGYAAFFDRVVESS